MKLKINFKNFKIYLEFQEEKELPLPKRHLSRAKQLKLIHLDIQSGYNPKTISYIFFPQYPPE